MSFLFATSFCLNAQLVNNGGTITIQANASLIVEGDVDQSSGTIVNNGTLSFTGNMTNDGIYTAGAASKLIATGTGTSELDMNGATVAILENAKTSGEVTLESSVEVSEAVDFSGTSDILLGDFNLILEEAATTNGSTTGHFVTDGVGTLNKELSAAGTYTADVGDGSVYSPISYVHSGTYSMSTINTAVTNMKHPDAVADADDFLNRYWETTTSITNPSLEMTGTYDAGDVSGTAGDMVGARWENTEWEFLGGSQSGMTVTGTTTETASELTGLNFFGKADFTVFLEGPYNSTTSQMDVTPGFNASIPLTSPYTSAPATATAIAADVVDWVLIEVRDVGALNMPITSVSALLLADGSIVSSDGTTLPLLKDASANSHLSITHRNHLGVMSANPIADFSTTIPDVDFGSGATSAYTVGPAGIKTMADGNFALFGGDGNNNGDVSATDLVNFWIPFNGLTINASNYSTAGAGDFNLNGDVSATDFVNAWIPNNSTISQIPQ